MNFCPLGILALIRWREFWPSRGNAPNWDAVGQVKFGDVEEWLLVEAKAHTQELSSDCKASELGGRPTIVKALESTKNALGIVADRDWLHCYYQFANRLAILHFLRNEGVKARLLFVYFVGDSFAAEPNFKFDCPKDEAGWLPALQAQSTWLGLEQPHRLSNFIHKLFIPVAGD